jgi:hypothetical protein
MTRRAKQHRTPLLVAATAMTVALVASCGVPDEAARPVDRDELPANLTEPPTTAAPTDGGQVAVATVHWIRGRELVGESVLFEAGPDTERLMALLERGPAGEDDRVRSAVSDDAIASVEVRDGTAVVELAEVTGPDQVLAIGQLVLTLTSLPEIDQVRVQRDGEPVEVPLPDGTLVSRPLQAQDYSSLVAAS